MSCLYSLKEIRSILEAQGIPIPDGTLRNYRDAFQDFLPSEGTGRQRRYFEESLGVFKHIRELRKGKHLDNHQVRAELSRLAVGSTGSMAITPAGDADPDLQRQFNDVFERLERLELVSAAIEARTKPLMDNVTRILSILQQKLIQDQKAPAITKDFLTKQFADLNEYLEKSGCVCRKDQSKHKS
jgi:hypothetical protein